MFKFLEKRRQNFCEISNLERNSKRFTENSYLPLNSQRNAPKNARRFSHKSTRLKTTKN